ncbi:acyl carrier protein [Alishewanella longhuensis]
MSKRKRPLLLCVPARGSYNRTELGYLKQIAGNSVSAIAI